MKKTFGGVQASTEPVALTTTSSMPPAEDQPDVEAHSSPDGDKQEAFDVFQKEITEWAMRTFPTSTRESHLKHFQREAKELLDSGCDPEEAADCGILLLGLAGREGFSLFAEMKKKFAINQARIWGKPDAEGVIEHVKPAADNAHAELVTHECALVGTVDGALNSQSGTAEKSGSASTQQNEIGAAQEGWIPVSERLPASFLTVLIWDGQDQTSGYYNHEAKGWGCHLKGRWAGLTHWQPLPAPPKESSKELKA